MGWCDAMYSRGRETSHTQRLTNYKVNVVRTSRMDAMSDTGIPIVVCWSNRFGAGAAYDGRLQGTGKRFLYALSNLISVDVTRDGRLVPFDTFDLESSAFLFAVRL